MSFFQTPEPDPEAARLRDAEEKRARRDRIDATQYQLKLETAFRRRGGILSLFGPLGQSGGLTSLLGSG